MVTNDNVERVDRSFATYLNQLKDGLFTEHKNEALGYETFKEWIEVDKDDLDLDYEERYVFETALKLLEKHKEEKDDVLRGFEEALKTLHYEFARPLVASSQNLVSQYEKAVKEYLDWLQRETYPLFLVFDNPLSYVLHYFAVIAKTSVFLEFLNKEKFDLSSFVKHFKSSAKVLVDLFSDLPVVNDDLADDVALWKLTTASSLATTYWYVNSPKALDYYREADVEYEDLRPRLLWPTTEESLKRASAFFSLVKPFLVEAFVEAQASKESFKKFDFFNLEERSQRHAKPYVELLGRVLKPDDLVKLYVKDVAFESAFETICEVVNVVLSKGKDFYPKNVKELLTSAIFYAVGGDEALEKFTSVRDKLSLFSLSELFSEFSSDGEAFNFLFEARKVLKTRDFGRENWRLDLLQKVMESFKDFLYVVLDYVKECPERLESEDVQSAFTQVTKDFVSKTAVVLKSSFLLENKYGTKESLPGIVSFYANYTKVFVEAFQRFVKDEAWKDLELSLCKDCNKDERVELFRYDAVRKCLTFFEEKGFPTVLRDYPLKEDSLREVFLAEFFTRASEELAKLLSEKLSKSDDVKLAFKEFEKGFELAYDGARKTVDRLAKEVESVEERRKEKRDQKRER